MSTTETATGSTYETLSGEQEIVLFRIGNPRNAISDRWRRTA